MQLAHVERNLEQVLGKDRLNTDQAQEVVDGVTHFELGDVIGGALQFGQRVEQEVAGLGLEALMPRITEDDHPVGRFIHELWIDDEHGHAVTLGALLRKLDIPVLPARTSEHIPPHQSIVGALGKWSLKGHQIVELIYAATGGMTEWFANYSYRIAEKASRDHGEPALADIFAHIKKDEAFHRGFYTTYGAYLRSIMKPWQLNATGLLMRVAWNPVGAGNPEDKARFGEVVTALEALDPDGPDVDDKLQEIAHDTLGVEPRLLADFARRKVQECVQLAQAA